MASSTTGSSRFVPNPGFEMELKRSTILLPDLQEVADDIVKSIQSVAPVDTGEFRDSFSTTTGADLSGVKAQVQTSDWKAPFIEYGTVEHDFSAPIRRGIEAAGYRRTE